MPSVNTVKIYISASPDLMPERETAAKMIAELPVSLPWHILQTPIEARPVDVEALIGVDLYFLVMGADIRAPVGLELHFARQGNQRVMAYLKRGVPLTPAGQVFIRQSNLNWHPYLEAADLGKQIQQHIVRYLLNRAIEYALLPTEVEQLKQLLVAGQTDKEPPQQNEGAGHSAVLLSRKHYEPGEGILIEDSSPSE